MKPKTVRLWVEYHGPTKMAQQADLCSVVVQVEPPERVPWWDQAVGDLQTERQRRRFSSSSSVSILLWQRAIEWHASMLAAATRQT